MSWTWVWLRLAIGFEGLVTMQTASRAILLKTIPPGSAGFGSREDIPRVTRPRETSVMPMSEPPCRITNLTLPLFWGWLTKALASLVASGATEVEPLIVIVAAEAVAAVASDALSASAVDGGKGTGAIHLVSLLSGGVRSTVPRQCRVRAARSKVNAA